MENAIFSKALEGGEMPRPVIYFLTGPSAVGKTEIAVRWAHHLGAEILSCDSLLVYRGMDIGTAKPTREERGGVVHHGIDIVEARRQYSVSDYERMAKRVIAGIAESGRQALVVGGSGFYLKSFFSPVTDALEVGRELRDSVRERYSQGGLEGILEELRRLNPKGLGGLDARNPRRVMRGLERCLASGQSLEGLAEAFALQPAPYEDYEKRCVCLGRGREDLRERVAKRTCGMLATGLLDEVSELLESGFEDNPSACGAIGYRESIAFLRKEMTRDEMEAAINRNTMALIKKQETWLKKQVPVDLRIQLEPGCGLQGEVFWW